MKVFTARTPFERTRVRVLILLAVQATPGVNVSELARVTRVSRRAVKTQVRALELEGMVLTQFYVGPRGAHESRVYAVPPPSGMAAAELQRLLRVPGAPVLPPAVIREVHA